MNLVRKILKRQDGFQEKLEDLSKQICELQAEVNLKNQQLKSLITKINNKEKIQNVSSDFFTYTDLSPHQAYEIFQKENFNFILLDVSKHDSFKEEHHIAEAYRIELEFLEMRVDEIPSKDLPILVISEDGTRSILACHILFQLGFLSISNISGGHQFWPGHEKKIKLVA